jgi:hypothetical protein
LSDFESLDSFFKINIRQRSFLRPGGLLGDVLENLGIDRLSRHVAAVIACVVIVSVIVISWGADLAGDRIIAVPVKRVTAIPIIAGVSVTNRPVPAQADEQVLAVIVRIHIPECEPWPAIIIKRETKSRPDSPRADTVVVISVGIVTAKRVPDHVRPVVKDHARRPEGVVTMQTRAVSTDAGHSCIDDFSSSFFR